MQLDVTLRFVEFPAKQGATVAEIDPNRESEPQNALVRAMIARPVRDRATALSSARTSTTAKDQMARIVRALGIGLITVSTAFFTVVVLSVYGGLPLFFV